MWEINIEGIEEGVGMCAVMGLGNEIGCCFLDRGRARRRNYACFWFLVDFG